MVKVWATEDGTELVAFSGSVGGGGSSGSKGEGMGEGMGGTGGCDGASASGDGQGGSGSVEGGAGVVGGKVWSVAWGADESFLVSGCAGGTAVIWNVVVKLP